MNSIHSKQKNWRKAGVLVVVLVMLFLLAWFVNHNVSLEALVEQEYRLRNLIGGNPWQSFLIGFVVYTAMAFVPGTGGKGIVWGWMFGFWQGVLIVSVGLTIAAMGIFYLSRYLFQETIERRYTNFVALMNKHIEKEGAFYLLTLRMAHAPFSIVNPVSGASRVAASTFFWTTAVGLLPANAIWVYVGVRLPSLDELANSGPSSFLDLPLIAALVACAALPPTIRLLLSRFGLPEQAGEITAFDKSSSEEDQ